MLTAYLVGEVLIAVHLVRAAWPVVRRVYRMGADSGADPHLPVQCALHEANSGLLLRTEAEHI